MCRNYLFNTKLKKKLVSHTHVSINCIPDIFCDRVAWALSKKNRPSKKDRKLLVYGND